MKSRDLATRAGAPWTPDADGRLKRTVFPGPCLDPAALLNFDLSRIIAEHAAFASRLEQGGRPE